MPGIGERIQHLRRSTGITCAALAQIAGVSRQYAHRIEQGKVTSPARVYLEKWAMYFKVDVQWLQCGQTEVKPRHRAGPTELAQAVQGSAMSRRLLAAMHRKNIHAFELSKRSGIGPERIRAWLSAEVRPESLTAMELFAIASAVGLSGHELLTGDPDEARSIHEFNASHETRIAELARAMEAIVEALGSATDLTPARHARLVMLAMQLLDIGIDRASLLEAIRMASDRPPLTLHDQAPG